MKVRLKSKGVRVSRVVVAVFSLCVAILIVYSFATKTGASAHIGAQVVRPVRAELMRAESVVLASPGRIEGLSDLVGVGAAIDGVIQTIHVKEGQEVEQGDILAELACNDLQSALRVANSELESLQQTRVRLLRGSRDEERQAAAQKSAAARAVVDQAAVQLGRMEKLREATAVSKQAYDEARRDADVAKANFEQAKRNEELVNAGPLGEEIARADADVHAAENRIKLAEDKLSKCVIRAPISGSILRVHLREGESFTTFAPRPLFSIADISGRKVRAEVDERDVGSVHVGQKVTVASDSYPGKSFSGMVTKLASIMGRKTVLTVNPAEKEDRDVLEVTARLDQAANVFPVGLRVTVQFQR
jgi:ABC exporter DevB family membrane fusion protein